MEQHTCSRRAEGECAVKRGLCRANSAKMQPSDHMSMAGVHNLSCTTCSQHMQYMQYNHVAFASVHCDASAVVAVCGSVPPMIKLIEHTMTIMLFGVAVEHASSMHHVHVASYKAYCVVTDIQQRLTDMSGQIA